MHTYFSLAALKTSPPGSTMGIAPAYGTGILGSIPSQWECLPGSGSGSGSDGSGSGGSKLQWTAVAAVAVAVGYPIYYVK